MIWFVVKINPSLMFSFSYISSSSFIPRVTSSYYIQYKFQFKGNDGDWLQSGVYAQNLTTQNKSTFLEVQNKKQNKSLSS